MFNMLVSEKKKLEYFSVAEKVQNRSDWPVTAAAGRHRHLLLMQCCFLSATVINGFTFTSYNGQSDLIFKRIINIY